MRTLIILGAVLIVLLILGRWFTKTPPQKISAMLKKALLYGGAALLLALVVTGRAHWIFAFVAGALPFAQRAFTAWKAIKFFQNMRGPKPAAGNAGNTGNVSRIQTQFLRMELDHDSGRMSGTVLEGRFKGQHLEDLGFASLIAVLQECRVASDTDSERLLETYLERLHKERWEKFRENRNPNQKPGNTAAELSTEEAYELLGLEPGASAEEIRKAHRRLMQKLHPDRGGSDYLAARINLAKDVLLKNRH